MDDADPKPLNAGEKNHEIESVGNCRTDFSVEQRDSVRESVSGKSLVKKAPVVWNKTEKVNHPEVKKKVAERLAKRFRIRYEQQSQSRYVSDDKEHALFIMSANYSKKNSEYWYSIGDEIIPWLELFPDGKVAFSLGSDDNILVFSFAELKSLLEGCLKTTEDKQKKKNPHYHIAFSVENERNVYFKRKKPERSFEDVTKFLISE